MGTWRNEGDYLIATVEIPDALLTDRMLGLLADLGYEQVSDE